MLSSLLCCREVYGKHVSSGGGSGACDSTETAFTYMPAPEFSDQGCTALLHHVTLQSLADPHTAIEVQNVEPLHHHQRLSKTGHMDDVPSLLSEGDTPMTVAMTQLIFCFSTLPQAKSQACTCTASSVGCDAGPDAAATRLEHQDEQEGAEAGTLHGPSERV